jgi:hypothetical protein
MSRAVSHAGREARRHQRDITMTRGLTVSGEVE